MQGNRDFRYYFFPLQKMYIGLLTEVRKLIVDPILMHGFRQAAGLRTKIIEV